MSSIFGKSPTSILANEMATGEARYNNFLRAQTSVGINTSPIGSVFRQYVVIEVISDTNFLSDGSIEVIQKLQSLYKEGKNINISSETTLALLPRNTIIGQPTSNESSGISGNRIILLPFFPSHLALPCKPGEHVWAMHPSNEATTGIEFAYWMCRVTPLINDVDDVNHTHHPRISNFENDNSSIKLIEKQNGNIHSSPEFRVGSIMSNEDGSIETSIDGRHVETDDELFYEKLITESDASQLMTYEPVPRFKKRPGDLCLEGSNNTLIVLGTDRTGPISDVEIDKNQVKKQKKHKEDLSNFAGSIDIVAGRGQSEKTGGKKIFSKKIDGSDFFEELDKKNIVLNEGDPDFILDKSRIFVSQKTSIDKKINIENFNKKFGIETQASGSAAILAKSDKLRLIARNDAQILVENKEGKPITTIITKSTGELILNSKNTTIKIDSAGNITLNSAGDITLSPSETGVIKLGGEDANKAILCQNEGVTGAGGQVIAPPVIDTMGGTMGTPGFGVFASKVLIK